MNTTADTSHKRPTDEHICYWNTTLLTNSHFDMFQPSKGSIWGSTTHTFQ